jgi:hypothetical protein
MKYFTDKQVEAIIMVWAAEHPEPVYPIWAEWLKKHGIIGIDNGRPYVSQRAYDNIPTDIAQKLGIEPKEG